MLFHYSPQNAPNPCSGTTSVSYRVPDNSTAAQLVVRESYSGRIRYQQVLAAGEHTINLSVAGLLPGAYLYTLEVDGRAVAHHQLLVQ